MSTQGRSVTIHFTIEGMAPGEDVDEIVAELRSHFAASTGYDTARAIFAVTLDPAANSFEDVRAVVRVLGARRGRQYLAVVMSP